MKTEDPCCKLSQPIFEIIEDGGIEKGGKHYKIYYNGHVEGCAESSLILNRIGMVVDCEHALGLMRGRGGAG